MDHSYIILTLLLIFICRGVLGATFKFVNKCDYTVWPGILGTSTLDSTGFELTKGNSRSLQAPNGWSGRFWGRTGCNFDGSGHGSCATGDCGSGQVECNGAGATPPATLAEFTLGSGSQDFYDVSLVDGYNLQMVVEVNGGSGSCATTGCVEDLNRRCPNELKVDGGGGCKSACDAFGTPEYCCKGAYDTPAACGPSAYSQLFKSACPRSYSYAYDDATSTFTCTGADYTVTFCPSFPSSKASKDPRKPSNEGNETETGTGTGSGSGSMEAMLANGSTWLANLANGGSSITRQPSRALQIVALIVAAISLGHSFMR